MLVNNSKADGYIFLACPPVNTKMESVHKSHQVIITFPRAQRFMLVNLLQVIITPFFMEGGYFRDETVLSYEALQ